ncbi:hypothetical protein [Streptomyces sp. NPDC006355]|uniref:hypothetical protein n=1 Tax=Streptomyces sp. NPDC006355 TaxID=3156758 RepID=UPI0033AEB5E6
MSELKVGDKIRILEDRHECAMVEAGDILTVGWVCGNEFNADHWYFGMENEGTGWERYEEASE